MAAEHLSPDRSARRIEQGFLVDSHTHLDLLDLRPVGGSLQRVIAEARAAGLGHMLCVAVSLRRLPRMLEIVRRWPGVSATAGLHPNDRGEPDEPDEAALAEAASAPEVVAVGETGLDYYRSEGDLEWQRERFRRHIRVARALGLPLVVHSRAAGADTLAILRGEGAAEVGGVLHCFTDGWETARQALDLGFHISFSGIVTFRNAEALREVARRVPLDRMLVETDAPYLAPVPKRGKPNFPAYVRHTAERIAALRGEPLARIAEATTEAFFACFPRARGRGVLPEPAEAAGAAGA